MNRTIQSALRMLIAGMLAAMAVCASAQQTYPAKPIHLIVPFPSGGSTDAVARIIAQKLGDSWGQQVLVENRGGGNTIIGSDAVAKSAADGYTILQTTNAHVINPSLFSNMPYDTGKDFSPIASIKSGKIRALAMSGDTRLAMLPDLPTFTEAGMPGLDITFWQGVFAPAGTPKAVVDKLAAELGRILTLPDVKEKLSSQGFEPFFTPPEKFAALIKTEIARFAKLIKDAKIKVDQ